MPPRKGIVKSGNAGNSSKASKPPVEASNDDKPLFPPGSKYPLSLLNERCQKNGWERPLVDTRGQADGYSFSVTLSRINKKTGEKESVRMEPHPPRLSPSPLEARHWGATYALYRFCNGIQLNRVLPPGPRDYWNELAAEHKQAPQHQAWMYEADPFAARKAVDERQAKAAKRTEVTQDAGSARPAGQASPEFANAPEAKMATELRSIVERSIRQAVSLYPEANDLINDDTRPGDSADLVKQLITLGFTAIQARNATSALSQASPLMSSLLTSLTPLQACIEYLILHVPECDLPQRFMPTINSSNSFITSAHAGTDDLKIRWIEERAVKECGWPAHVVRELITDQTLVGDWSLFVKTLNDRLLGDPAYSAPDSSQDSDDRIEVDDGDLEALGAHYANDTQLVMPLPVAPIVLNVMLPPDRKLPLRGTPPPMYITSTSVPAYVRLHLVSKLLLAYKTNTLLDPEETVVMAMMRVLEEEWAMVETNGPPDMSLVLEHMLPRQSPLPQTARPGPSEPTTATSDSFRLKGNIRRKDDRSDIRVKEEFEALCKSDGYTKMLSARARLPSFTAKDRFLDLLRTNQCVVVVGETGCGKTTQLPQFILDSLILANRGSSASILVTQPRRLSAIGVAARVSAERLEDGSVGYAIRGESKQTKKTKLLFCTTGVVLRRLGSGDKLRDVTHVIVDEVHERSVDGDLLLLELRELMRQHKTLKVVLMSATINHEAFVKYFNNAPLLSIAGFAHPVQDLYLEDVLPLINYRPSASKGSRKITEEERQSSKDAFTKLGLDNDCVVALQNISRSDRVDYELISAIVKRIISTAQKPGGILIFLPGVQEIRQCIESLRGIARAKILPLHANLSSDEQRLVFAPTSDWKIVASTNVAETSITIDDIVYVIDSGKVKETHYDPQTGLTGLVEQWVTRAAARQRRGRAGRTQPGFCYKLYTRRQEQNMVPFPIPEIKRMSLESVSLTVKVLHDDVKSFLARALDPPDTDAIDRAMAELEEIGAISPGGEVTPLGQHLATLPVDLRLGKMLILGTIFQCLGPILTVVACLSCKPLFVSPVEKREEASRARERFMQGNSDILTDVNAYNECFRLRSEGASQSAIRAFCEQHFISPTTIRDITSLRQDFLSALSSLNLVPASSTPTSPALNAHSTNLNLVKAVILGGLWPRVSRVSLPRSAIKFDRVQAGTVQRENAAKEYKFYDIKESGGRVFLHPGSVLFGTTAWKTPFVAYFQKQMTSKVFLRDATELPLYALLLFGGPVSVNHIGGGLTVGRKDAYVKLKAWPRIGVLVNQLRRLLDIQLARCVDEGTMLSAGGQDNPVLEAILALLTGDGLTS